VSAPNPLERRWDATYVTYNVDFRITLACGEIQVPYTESGIGCGGPGLNWVQDSELGTYSPNNDRVFTIRIIENVDNGCGAGVNPGTVIQMRKVEEDT